jgi:acetyltransferase-like isoleucine patch superfamily enzyme
MYPRPLVLVGTRQDIEPLLEIAEENNISILGILDQFYVGQKFEGIDVIGSENDLLTPNNKNISELVEYADFFVTTFFGGVTNTDVDSENTFKIRMNRINLVKKAGCNLSNLIHPAAIVSKTSKIGRNVLMFPTSRIESHCSIGSFCQFMYYNVIAHHSVIGENCSFMPGTTGTGSGVVLGNNVIVGTDTHIVSTNTHSTKIGNNVILAPWLTIAKDIPDNSVVQLNGKIIPNKNFVPDMFFEDNEIVSKFKRVV